MSLRTALLSGAVLTNLVVGFSSVAVVPQLTEHIADRKLDAVIVELAAGPAPASRPESSTTSGNLGPGTALPAGTPASSVPLPTLTATHTPPTSDPAATAPPSPITRAAVDARPASPGAAPPAVVNEAIEDEFDGKGIARASNEQQLSLAKAVCSAFDHGYSRKEILARALQEQGTTASGVNRFLDLAIAATCPEYRSR